jgi:hypothetical protein
MSKYLVVTRQGLTLMGGSIVTHYFDTYEEAEEFAKKLTFDVTIYEATARVTIQHEVERLGPKEVV